MLNIRDLNIETEILTLFDRTLNQYAKEKLLGLLLNPLKSPHEIEIRQSILRGFIKNNKVLGEYSYPVSYILEVHEFLTKSNLAKLPKNKVKHWFFASKKDKVALKSKLSQVVLLFHRLNNSYFKNIDLDDFPTEYKTTIKSIYNFLNILNLDFFESQVRKGFTDTNVVDISQILSQMLGAGRIEEFWEDLFLFEAYLSISQVIKRNVYIFPEISSTTTLELKGFYHPLLDNPVTNDISFSGNVFILTGANMSGKSTLLKAIGLSIYLGHIGLAIPAISASFSFFEGIFIGINHQDNLLSGYSHFMTEIINLKEVLLEATKNKSYFAVFDELFSGTNVEDAKELIAKTILGLSRLRGSMFFISTHIQQLHDIDGLNNNISTYYINCEILNNVPSFTYKLVRGWSRVRVGGILFEKEGLNALLKQ